MSDNSLEGGTVQDLDELYLKFNYHKEMLVGHKVLPGCFHEKYPLEFRNPGIYDVLCNQANSYSLK